METSASLSADLTRTPVRGWAVALLSRLQMSSVMLTSFTFGIFLPAMSQDLRLSPFEVGVLQAVWWTTSALLSLPCSVWFSRLRPVPLIPVSLLLGVPFLFIQGLAQNFLMLFLARFFFVFSHVLSAPARPLLLQQWVAPRQYAAVNAVGLSQHSILLALAMSTSGLLITTLGWRLAYHIHGSWFLLQTLIWLLIAREGRAPAQELRHALQTQQSSPLRALHAYPQGWLLGITMLALAATWTTVVTFLPTLLLQKRGITPTLSGPLLGFLYGLLYPRYQGRPES
jgi:predicted MFS family arabinose efflux permease